MNQILLDGIINCSTRYRSTISIPLQLTLEEALPLVSDKFKNTCRVLIFLNKGEPPKPEIWVFTSTLSTNWLNTEYWAQIPIGFSGVVDDNINSESINPVQNKTIFNEFQKVVYSEQVRDIKIVDKAPGVYDNTLYLEYLPMENKSIYQIQLPKNMESPVYGEPYKLPVNISTYILGESGIDFARLFINTQSRPFDESKVVIETEYPEGVEYKFTDRGYIGNDATGFPLEEDANENVNLTLTFTDKGDYSMLFRVINIDGGSTLAEVEYNFQVI